MTGRQVVDLACDQGFKDYKVIKIKVDATSLPPAVKYRTLHAGILDT